MINWSTEQNMINNDLILIFFIKMDQFCNNFEEDRFYKYCSREKEIAVLNI